MEKILCGDDSDLKFFKVIINILDYDILIIYIYLKLFMSSWDLSNLCVCIYSLANLDVACFSFISSTYLSSTSFITFMFKYSQLLRFTLNAMYQ